MGVKDLWSILQPICEKKPLWTLQGQIVAIDLSAWVCDSQNVTDHCVQPNMYLRNLFFRTCYLLLLGVKPIFILEGKAPEIKYRVMENRKGHTQSKNQLSTQVKNKGSRSHLKALQKQCATLLEIMGIKCFIGKGEAEALCAYLNQQNVVDGVITQDGDSLLYGAKMVYRKFNMSTQGGGNVEVYDVRKIDEQLALGRNKLIALSLLCGCDYNEKGVVGVGREMALKFLQTVDNADVLQRLNEWKYMDDVYFSTRPISKLESSIRSKAILDPDFPYEAVQKEFLLNHHQIEDMSFRWGQPNLEKFLEFASSKLSWEPDYATQKFLPVLSRWHLLHDKSVFCPTISFQCILKRRVHRGVPSYEVNWKNFQYTTIEPEHILMIKYGVEVEKFKEMHSKKKEKKETKSKRSKAAVAGTGDLKVATIETFIKNMGLKSMQQPAEVLQETKNNIINSECREDKETRSKLNQVYDCGDLEDTLSPSDFECSASDLLELSAIVESIVNR